MDNFRFDITSDGDILPALKLAFGEHRGKVWQKTVSGYGIYPADPFDPERPAKPLRPLRMVLFWTDPKGMEGYHPLPFKMDANTASAWIMNWLKEAEYPKPYDHDGDNLKGWRIYNDSWGHVDNRWEAVVAIAPVWALYGK